MLIEPLPQGDLAKRKRHERVGRPPRHYNFIQEITGIPKLRQHLLRGDRRGWCLSGFFVVRSDSLRNSSQDLDPLVKLIIVSACLQEPEKAVAFSTPQKSVTKHLYGPKARAHRSTARDYVLGYTAVFPTLDQVCSDKRLRSEDEGYAVLAHPIFKSRFLETRCRAVLRALAYDAQANIEKPARNISGHR